MVKGRIPHRYFLLFDSIVLTLGIVGANLFLPLAQEFVAQSGLLHLGWVQTLSIPDQLGTKPTGIFFHFFWVSLPMLPTIILSMEVLGGYRQLLNQSFTRIVITSIFSPLVGFGLFATALFAVRDSSISRLFVFLFMALSALGLCTYRIVLRMYFMHRKTAGRYARNVLLIGTPSAIDFMTRHLGNDRYSIDFRIIGYLDLDSSQSGTGTLLCEGDQQGSPESALLDNAGREEPLGGGSK